MATNIVDEVTKVLGANQSVDISINDKTFASLVENLHKAKSRLELARAGIAVDFSQTGQMTIRKVLGGAGTPEPKAAAKKSEEAAENKPTNIPSIKRAQHSYVPPMIAKDMISVICDEASHNIWLTGQTQCGKTTLVKHIGKQLGRKVYQINCRGDMGSEVFFGEKTVVVDEATKQNCITFQKGIVEQAMVEGLDAQGNEVGEPAILFVDEAASMPAHVAIGLNRLLESDDARRSMMIAEDGGRLVRSHSKFRIILAANTVGRGANSTEDAMYSAQMDALDISLLNRVAVVFRMGYNRDIEKHILMEKVGNDKVVSQILTFRDAIRGFVKQGKLFSPFSTKRIVDIANMYRVFGDLGKAIYYTVFEQLLPDEKAIYNEQAVVLLGKDLMKDFVQSNIDY